MATITYQQAIHDALKGEMEKDPSVFLMGIDVVVSPFGQTAGLVKEFGSERVRNTCIAESAIAGMAIGAALNGMRPVAEIMFADFLYLAMDAIATQMGSWRYITGSQAKLPLVVRTTNGAGMAMGYNHSQNTEPSFMGIPGIKVAVPATPYDALGLLRTAIRDDNPVIFFEHRLLLGSKGEVPEEEYTIPFGKADIKRPGKDATIVATQMMVFKALEAAAKLAAEGIEVEIVDPRTIAPLDKATICESVKKTKHLITVEESRKCHGIGAEIAAIAASELFFDLDAPVERVAAPDVPIPGSPALEQAYIPSADAIFQAVKKTLQ